MDKTPETVEENKSSQIKKSDNFSLPSIISVISLVSLVLYLTGLGVALSVETNFGMPHVAVFGSGFDLLQLSIWGISRFIVGFGEAVRDIRLYWKLLTGSWPLLIGVFASWTLLVIILKTSPWTGKKPENTGRIKKWLKAPSFKDESTGRLLVHGVVLSVLVAVLGPLVALAAVLGIAFLCVALAVLPIIAIAAGDVHIRDYVIGAESCAPLANRETRMQWASEKKSRANKKNEDREKVANCVKIIREGDVVGVGRIVFATSDAIVLYSPNSGAVTRVPLKDSVVEVVGALE